jgi:pilus assembly protein FimV
LTLNLDQHGTPAEEAADSAPVTSADEEVPTGQEPSASEAAGEEVADTAAEVAAEPGAGEEMADTAAAADTSPVQAAEPAGGEPQDTQKSEPVADKPAPAASGSALDDIPIMPVVGGVAIAGLLGLLVLLRRRRNEIEPEPVGPAAAVPAGPVSLKESVPSVDARLSALDQLIAARDWDAARGVAEELHATNPERPDITGKLLSSLHGAGDGAAFTDLAKKLVVTGFAADHPDLWGRVEQMGRELMPSEELFAASATAADDAEEDLDEMLDTLETRIDSADDELRREAADVLGEAATHLEPADAGRDEVDEWQEQDSTLEMAGVAPLSEDEIGTPVAEILEPVGEPEAEMPDMDLESTAGAPVSEPEQGTDTIEFETVALSPDDMVADETGAEAEPEPRAPEDMIEFDLDQLALGEEQGAGEEEQDVDEAEVLTPNEAAAVELDNIIALHGQESEEGPTEEKDLPDGLVAGGASEEDVQTKLDLARAFLDLGDSEGARGILEEVVVEGNDRQREEAESLLSKAG